MNSSKKINSQTKFIPLISAATLLGLVFLLLNGCGFHLRGMCEVPCEIKILSIDPNDPGDPFQRVLRDVLKTNGIIVANCAEQKKYSNILKISPINFIERAVAYGPSNQPQRATLQLTLTYEFLDKDCQVILPCNTIEVERDFTVNNSLSILGTENERLLVQHDLYNDAALLLVRQLSKARKCN